METLDSITKLKEPFDLFYSSSLEHVHDIDVFYDD